MTDKDWDYLRSLERARAFYKRHHMVDPDDPYVIEVKRRADDRQKRLSGSATTRALGKDFDTVGASGEYAFELWIGAEHVETLSGDANRNVNQAVNGRKVNVLTARKPTYLLVEKRKNRADFYVLAEFNDDTYRSRLIGWASKAEVRAAPIRDAGGKGIKSHTIPRGDLHPMDTLKAALGLAPEQGDLFGGLL